MPFETLIVQDCGSYLNVVINRPKNQNSINFRVLQDLHRALDVAEDMPNSRVVILEGQNDLFCSGLDFQEILSWNFDEEKIHDWAKKYMDLLGRFANSSNVIITKLSGKAIAGGIGFAAASDYILAHPKADFRLTEALWGLVPAMITPYLIRRIGYQKTYSLTLTARTIPAHEAFSFNLVDEINEQMEDSVGKLLLRFSRLSSPAIKEVKTYFRKMWIIDPLQEKIAINEFTKLLQNPSVQDNIRNYIVYGRIPWKVTK